MHCQGNDFVFLDLENMPDLKQDWSMLARRLTDRHFGIGGDGLVLMGAGLQTVWQPGDQPLHWMRIFNADGSEAETCGSAILCTAYYLGEKHNKDEITLDTIKGEMLCKINRATKSVTTNMGKVTFEKELSIPCPTRDEGVGERRGGAISFDD